MKPIAILGDGITAKAVREFIEKNNEFVESKIENAELIITSPGIPPSQWPTTDIEIISDIEFAFRVLKSKDVHPKIIGVTGTNGKTTVTAGLAYVLQTTPYGNIGRPLLLDIESVSSSSTLVIELSSFQLAASKSLTCDMAVILNIEPDHLAWHQTFEAYKQAKLSIVKPNQQLYIKEELIKSITIPSTTTIHSIESLERQQFSQFSGEHNQLNASIIVDIALNCGMQPDDIIKKLTSFKLPPFRCQQVFSNQSLKIINDSKATNMSATKAAVLSFPGKKCLILSGQAKEPFNHQFMASISQACSTIYAAGELSKNKALFPEEWRSKVEFFDSLELATASALVKHKSGTILFSPAAASFDEFKNYTDRGDAFNTYVNQYI